MRIYTSYFYQVRFFPRNLIPVSTAVSDPKWFHDFKGQHHMFFDGRGVCCGIRAEMFTPKPECHLQGDFLETYEKQLEELSLPKVMQALDSVSKYMQKQMNLECEPDIALMVHEAPDNELSERVPIQNWFRRNGVEVTEWSRSPGVQC